MEAIGPFEIEGVLGEGGSAIVYAARRRAQTGRAGGAGSHASGAGAAAGGTDASAADASGADASSAWANSTDASGANAGGTDANGAWASGTRASSADAGGARANGSNVSGTDASAADASGTAGSAADGSGADARAADASGADAGGVESDVAPTVARAEELALKVLRPELMLSEREVEAFLAEARRAQRVRHPSLVEIREAGLLPDGRPYLAMPRLRGECLAERVKRGPFAVEAGLRLFRGVAEAIETLHAAGLVHRDIKPENVFVIGAEERLVLLDLGIAREMDAPASTTTQAGLVRGTPAYMAPERFFGARASARTDTYEAAVLLYVMLAGRLPWQHAQDAVGRMSPRDPRTLVTMAEPVAAAILRGLSVDERARPQSVRELLEEVTHAAISTADTTLAPVLGGATPPAPTLPSPGAARVRAGAVIALSAPPPPGDIATQDTVAISTGRVRRGGPSWVPAVFAACVLAGAGAGVAAFVVPRGGDAGGTASVNAMGSAGASAKGSAGGTASVNAMGSAGASAKGSAGAAARPGDVAAGSAGGDEIGGAGAASSADTGPGSGEVAGNGAASAPDASGGAIGGGASGAGAQPASSAASDVASGAGATAAGSKTASSGAGSMSASSANAGSTSAGGGAGAAKAGSANAGSTGAGSTNTGSTGAGSANTGSASAGNGNTGSATTGSTGGAASAAASAAPAAVAGAHLADCMSLLALYCSAPFKATDGGTTCTQWSATIHGYRLKPQEMWPHFNEGCKIAHRGAVLALAERQRQIAAGKGPQGASPKTP